MVKKGTKIGRIEITTSSIRSRTKKRIGSGKLNNKTSNTTTTEGKSKDQCQELPEIVERLHSENNSLRDHNDSLENQLTQLENEIKLLNKKHLSDEKRIEAIYEKQLKKKCSLDHKNISNTSLRNECDVMIKNFDHMSRRIDDFRRSRTEMKQKLTNVLSNTF